MSVLSDFPELVIEGLLLQTKTEVFDAEGGWYEEWETVVVFDGIIDLVTPYDGKSAPTQKIIEDSTHILICEDVSVEEQQRVVHDSKVYHVVHVDDPSNLGSHLEVYLHYNGETDGV